MIESIFHYLSTNGTLKFFDKFSMRVLGPFVILILFIIILIMLLYFNFYKASINSQVLPDAIVTPQEEFVSTSNIVEISGAVKRPGVYNVASEARIVDVLKIAEGFAVTADIVWVSKNISLAEKTVDSAKIYIPFIWDSTYDTSVLTEGSPKGVSKFLAANNNVINTLNANISNNVVKNIPNTSASNDINSCSKDVLLALNGVGDVYASKIIANRPYKDLSDLIAKIKLPEKVIKEIETNLIF